jgi:hypothetical protein
MLTKFLAFNNSGNFRKYLFQGYSYPNMQSVTKKCGKLWARVPHTQIRKVVHINMSPETFYFWVITERVHLQ